MISEEDKNLIDNMAYETMLRRWLLAPWDDKIFQGETGTYYSDVMRR
jgi:hypothetical protein